MTADLFELRVWAEGQLTDADGNLLDADGNPLDADGNPLDEPSEGDEPEGDES